MDRTGANRLVPGQNYRRGVAVPPNAFPLLPFATAAVRGRALS
jgi:hypothetical protein